MKFDVQTAARYAGEKLDLFLARAVRDSAEVIERANIPETIIYFAELREVVQDLAAKTSMLTKHVEELSQEFIPTMFMNQHVKSFTVPSFGRATINVRWSASMLDKETGFGWLRQTKNEGLIIETVNAQTLGAFAREQALAGQPLPSDIFKVGTSSYTSITKG